MSRTPRIPRRRAVGSAFVALTALALLGTAAIDGSAEPHRARTYPVHTGVTATVFWIGEPVGNGSTADNAVSAYDDRWEQHYGGFDDPRSVRRYPYFPPFRPQENPFYLDLPYDDFRNDGTPRPGRELVVPWAPSVATQAAAARSRGRPFSLMKNRWVRLWHRRDGKVVTCYGQIEDAGPYVYDDADYVFGRDDPRPRSARAHHAGLDVSPALRDCLRFKGLNNASNRVGWQFVDDADVPRGPWRLVVTTRQVFWP